MGWIEQIITAIVSSLAHAAITQPLYTAIADFVCELVNMNNNFTISLFDNDMVILFIGFAETLGSIFFLFGIGFAFAEWAVSYNEGTGVDIMSTFKNCLIGFAAVSGFTILPISLLAFTNDIAHTLCVALVDTSGVGFDVLWTDALGHLENLDLFAGWGSPIFFIVVLICTVRIFLANIKRGGILTILITVGSLHMFSIPRGYTDAFFSWCKQIVGLCITSFLQNVLLMMGLAVYLSSNIGMFDVILASGLMLSATEAPRILQQFGLDTSMKTHVSQAIYGVSGAMNIASCFIH